MREQNAGVGVFQLSHRGFMKNHDVSVHIPDRG